MMASSSQGKTFILFFILHGYFDYTVAFQGLLNPYWAEYSYQRSIMATSLFRQ